MGNEDNKQYRSLAERTHVLDGLGLQVLRFSHADVLNHLGGVVTIIEAYLAELQL